LILSSINEHAIKRTKKKTDGKNLFTKENVPINIAVRVRRIPQWVVDSENVIGLLPQSPVQSEQPDETLTLIPMASARLRITTFPLIVQ
jgi:hypothetical protein